MSRMPDLRSLLRGVVAATAIGLASASMVTIASAQEPSEALLIADFDARPLSTSEKRIIQIALAMEGEYNGLIDGAWGRRSQAALDAYAAKTFGDIPRYIHIAALVSEFAANYVDEGWVEFYRPEFGVTFLLPANLVDVTESSRNHYAFEGKTDLLGIDVERHGSEGLEPRHRYGLNKYGARGEVYRLRERHRWVTSFQDRDGDYWYVRTEPVNGTLTTVTVLADPQNRNVLNAISTSILPGRARLLEPDENGVLFEVIELAADALDGADSGPNEAGSAGSSMGGTGSGVMVTSRGHIITNYHVVEGCRSITANGASVELEKFWAEEDIALLSPMGDFSLLVDRPKVTVSEGAAELNQDITVAGYPLGGELGGLNVTRGSVSSRAGPGGDTDFFQFTAAVQPGNSGGPILDASGQLVGLVVAKADERVFADAAGALPQDISFGISLNTISAFLDGVPGVKVGSWYPSLGTKQSPVELARFAETVTYLVECN